MSQLPSSNAKSIMSLQKPALVVGIVCFAVMAIVGSIPRMHDEFFRAYLFGWLFWLAVSLGAGAMISIHGLCGGNWGRLTRPIASALTLLIPLNGILFVPILFGTWHIFPWARPVPGVGWLPFQGPAGPDPVITHKSVWLNWHLFTLRYVIYFMVWTFFGFLIVKTGENYSKNKNPAIYEKLKAFSSLYMVFYIALITLAGVDWIMSREPHWESTIFGFILTVNQCLTALLVIVIVTYFLMQERPELKAFGTPDIYNDLGNLLLMMVILWAYMNFAQFLITWTGNEQEDIGWYIQRTYGAWRIIAGILIFLHFLVPFVMLLMRPLKRDIKKLAGFSCILLFLRLFDLYWMMSPSGHEIHDPWLNNPILDIFAFGGIGGIYMFAFLAVLKNRPLLPTPFPEELEKEAMNHGHHAPQPG